MSRNNCSFFAISGMRGSGRTRLFRRLEFALSDRFRDHTFAFFEDPFGALQHPLLWARQESERDPTTRLFDCWSRLNEFNRRLRPALESHDVVVVDGYGLNAVLYATAYTGDNFEDDAAAIRMHHLLVKARILEQGISPPEYFITRGDIGVMTRYLQQTVPGLSVGQCHAFIQKEERIMADYFRPETKQVGTIFEPELSPDDVFKAVINRIDTRLAEKRLAA